jgi:hypothetical protein
VNLNNDNYKNIIVVCIIVLLSLYIFDVIKIPQASNSTSSKAGQQQSLPNAQISKAFNQPAQPLPETGTTVKYYNSQAMAPLSIATKSDGTNYLIKVVDWNTKSDVLTTFIRTGEKVSIKVPLGSYEIRYAAGKTWYGYEYLFGPGTSYYKADQKMDFTQSGNAYQGHTIELIPRAGGNLHTSNISENNF